MTLGAPPVVILDIDGTLVDSNYQHVRSWSRAMAQHGVVVPAWELHRAIGMGGDQLIAHVAGEEVEQRAGDDIRAAEGVLYQEFIDEIQLLPGAQQLVRGLAARGGRVVLASSAKQQEVDHYLGLLDSADAIFASTSSTDVDATKPHPELVEVAVERAESSGEALMIGDSTWDARAAERAGLASIGVLTGGFAATELREAGAHAVYAGAAHVLAAPEITRHLSI